MSAQEFATFWVTSTLVCSSPARAVDYIWQAGDGQWTDSGRWTLLHTGAVPAGATAWAAAGAATLQTTEPSLVRWLADHKAESVVLLPDGFVYAATSSGGWLPGPPAGLNLTTLTGASA